MPTELHWDDAEDIGLLLADKFPSQNPLEIRFTDLRRKVVELPLFSDDSDNCNEAKLEAIQMAWHEEWTDRQE
jgi:FeS assembly protein IscX